MGVGMGERLGLMDAVRHRGQHCHPGGSGPAAALAGLNAAGLLLPYRPAEYDADQRTDAAAPAHPEALRPGLPARLRPAA